MTIIASADGTAVVNPRATGERRRRMTEVAIQSGANVVGIHADRGRTIVTGNTIVHDAGMVKGCGDEGVRIVTDAAILIGGEMII
ncbi:MAG: hypothetical protein CL797_08815 [Chromatiales bacterium]|nr:hypothetical protein [Chromatiales bacterium]